MNRKIFYDIVRASLFKGSISAKQLQGMEALLNEWDSRKLEKLQWLAYILGTVYWETGQTMQSIKEYGGEAYLKTKAYYPWYGRDMTQTTWKANYQKVKDFSGVDVIANPNKIAEINLAAKVAVHFMIMGWYTGKKLSDYLDNADLKDDKKKAWKNARRIINGVDKAEAVADIAIKFYDALKQAG